MEEEKKKQNQHRFLKITILFMVFFLSFLLGKYVGTDKNITVEEKTYKPKETKQFSNHIAVVDLDDGVDVGREKKYYSKEIIELPNLDFTYTGLGDARTGLEDGTYGAYIVIPSTFSRSVTSLNENPTKAKLKFEIDRELDGEVKSQVIYNLLKFEQKLNNDLSYVYVNNILKEFHEAQDISKKVMNNDSKDKKAILEIQPYDLIEMVEMPELERVDSTTEPLDFSNYIAVNQDIISEINEEYKKQIDINLDGINNLRKEGESLADELNEMIDGIGEINIIRDKDGNVVYEKGVDELNSEITTYNTDLDGNKKHILNNMKSVSENQGIIQETINNIISMINEFNEELTSQIEYKKGEIKERLVGFIPAIQLNMSRNQETLGISYGERESGINIDIIRDINEDDKEIEEAYIYALQQILSEVNDNEEIKESLSNDKFLELIEQAGFDELDDFLASNISREVSQDYKYKLRIRENEEERKNFTNYVGNKLEEFDLKLEDDIKGIEYDSDVLEEFSQLIGEQSNNLSETNDKIEEIETINDAKLNNIITDEIVKPLETQADKVKDNIKDRNEKERNLIREYNASIDGYEPIYEYEEVDNKLNTMNENAMNLYDDIDNNNEQYMTLIDKVFESYDNNTNTLMDNMQETRETLEEKIDTGLEEAKNIKNTTSKENQDLLDSFSKKLGYTRVGSIEYTEVYDFIANPINLESSKEFTKDKKPKDEEPSYADLDKSDDKIKKDIISDYKLLLIMGVSLFSLLVIFILLRRDKA